MHPRFPLPAPDDELTTPFWDAAARHQLAIPRCDGCGAWVWYPRPRCPACDGSALTWTPVSGRGRLFSWTVVRHAFLPVLSYLGPATALAMRGTVRGTRISPR